MASNKFATVLHRNTNKLTLILVYTVLEWLLIVLLLLNSLFSYLITKFAKWVGLKPPCPLCSRVDHVLEPGKKSRNLDRDLVCEAHAAEISKLGFCSNHGKLAETQSMCEDCLSSRPNHNENSIGITHRIAFLSWVNHNNHENGEDISRCSCCNESLSSRFYPPYLPLKPSWGDGNFKSKGTLIVEAIDDKASEDDKELQLERNNGEDLEEDEAHEHQILSDIESFILREVAEDLSSSVSNLHSDEKDAEKDEKEDHLIITELDPSAFLWEDRSFEFINLHFSQNAASDVHRLIPVELIDSSTSAEYGTSKPVEDLGEKDQKIETFAYGSPIEAQSSNWVGEESVKLDKNAKKSSMEEHESLEDSLVLEVEESKPDSLCEVNPQNATTEAETATEETDNGQVTLRHSQGQVCSYESTEEDQSFSSDDDTEVQNAFDEFIAQNNLCKPRTLSNEGDNDEPAIEEPEDAPAGSVKTGENDSEHAQKNHGEKTHQSSKFSESHEVEEDKLPETPTSVDGLHYLHRKLTLFEKRELGAEESVDGSIASEAESGDPASTIEKLKTALKSERKALGALYQELEEERSASAIAANQTMAMITRLQEEKAAMQMEALQYQRMMEEQSEYDQEALQLLNELMLKREKEKQELEKELEEYRQKVIEYEAKEKLRALRRMKDGSVRSRDSSSSCSNMEYTDDLSDDLNREAREKDNGFHNNPADDEIHNLEEMALDCVNHLSALDNSFEEFEEEKLSILDQLKVLEDKLLTLYENEQFSDGNKELNENCNLSSAENDGYSPRKAMASLAKRLLPYLDEAEAETEEAYTVETQVEPESFDVESSLLPMMERDCRGESIEEEVDHVYERLQALEADREFIQHCMGSVQQGDKGMNLLQEILQHLRDLKAVEIQVKSLSDNSV
ncbi:hypothetical protein L6164_033037 [Bauhinia variegata]|uniref:Uncharacterized protein n=1 Tax=Bauhinia variegata TaxID=167791 RepID=A0ACB9KRC7_BAUVA|nr:hypothetical protein L6164_033037 [Bauhinia variegata]